MITAHSLIKGAIILALFTAFSFSILLFALGMINVYVFAFVAGATLIARVRIKEETR